jgi:branched-subunit amino acid ABC-type transport system permease component
MDIFGIPLQAFLGQLLLGLVNGSFYAMLSLGLAVIFGLLNVINFTHGAQYMMGAFGAWMLLNWLGVPFWVSLTICQSSLCFSMNALAIATDSSVELLSQRKTVNSLSLCARSASSVAAMHFCSL